MGKRLHEVFGGRVAFGLEGGYNVEASATVVTMKLLMRLRFCEILAHAGAHVDLYDA